MSTLAGRKISTMNDKIIQAQSAHDQGLITEVELLNCLHNLILSTKESVKEIMIGHCHEIEEDIKAISVGT